MKRRLVMTEDGSPSIRVDDLEENFHSQHGAIQEAKHVFIRNGLDACTNDKLDVFEVGLGTGLNAFLAAKWSKEHRVYVKYYAIELYPLESDLFNPFKSLMGELVDDHEDLDKIYNADWNVEVGINASFQLHKIHEDVLKFEPEHESFDVIFFDAFGFRAQPELWSFELLQKMHRVLRKGGMLVTYASRGQLKRDLKSIGFVIETLPGPPGKREMLRAIK